MRGIVVVPTVPLEETVVRREHHFAPAIEDENMEPIILDESREQPEVGVGEVFPVWVELGATGSERIGCINLRQAFVQHACFVFVGTTGCIGDVDRVHPFTIRGQNSLVVAK